MNAQRGYMTTLFIMTTILFNILILLNLYDAPEWATWFTLGVEVGLVTAMVADLIWEKLT